MDDLPNILQDSYGLRPQGKSAPMSSAKKMPPNNSPAMGGGSGRMSSRTPSSYGVDSTGGFGGSTFRASSIGSGSPYRDDVFGGSMGRSTSPLGNDDIFSGPSRSGSQPLNLDDDIFGPPAKSSSSTGLYGMGGSGGDPFGSEDIFGMGKPSGSSGSSGTSAKTYSSANAFDDILGSGGFDAAAKPSSRKNRTKPSSTSGGDDLLGGFSAEASSPSSRKKSERSKAAANAPAADPFAAVDVDPLFGGPPPSTTPFGDPFDPFFVPSTPPPPEPRSGPAIPSNGSDGLSGLDAFAKFAGSSVNEHSPHGRKSKPGGGKESAEKPEKPKATSRRSGHSTEPSVKTPEQVQDFRAAPKLSRSSSAAAKEAREAREGREPREAREPRRGPAPETNVPAGFGPQEGAHVFKDTSEESWLTLEDIILKTQPMGTPPPARPPPPVGSQTPIRSKSPPQYPSESARLRSEPRPEIKTELKVEPEVEPQPPSATSRFPPRRPSHHSGEQAPRNHEYGGRSQQHSAEQAPRNFPEAGGLDGLDDFASGGRHRRRPSEGKQPTPPRRQPEPAPGDGMDGLDDFASGGSSRRRQSSSESKGDASPPRRERTERRRDGSSESGGRYSHDVNDSAEAAEQSAAAMKEVLERAKLKAEAARKAREQERERERQEVEAAKEAANRARAKAAEAQQEARAKAEAEARAQAQRQKPLDDLDSFFSGTAAPRAQSDPRPRPAEKGPSNLDDLGAKKRPAEPVKRSPPAPTPAPAPASADGWADILGGSNVQVPVPNGAPILGEPDERRKLRVERERRTAERAAEALREKNRRDADALREQAERDRAGDSLDIEIRKWAAGKQGNIRALLSTLQYVLWPECNWDPVPLTDLMNGASVKKSYRKATLCVHPDKVQQKGATIQQKYIAEKVFDLLKEAWNKFNSEELF